MNPGGSDEWKSEGWRKKSEEESEEEHPFRPVVVVTLDLVQVW